MTSKRGGEPPTHRDLTVRLCHWINVIAVGYLVVSGAHIFLDFPELYWGKVGFQGHPAAFKLADWGISWDQAAALGDRRWGRNYHFTFAWVFMINGLIYVGASTYRKHFRQTMLPRSSRTSGVHPGPERYEPLQGAAYIVIIFVVTPILFLTGIAQMPAFTAIAPWLIDGMGGRQTARTLHTLSTILVILFAVAHVIKVFRAGFLGGMRGMITGRGERR